jgi:hypothetical protein
MAILVSDDSAVLTSDAVPSLTCGSASTLSTSPQRVDRSPW